MVKPINRPAVSITAPKPSAPPPPPPKPAAAEKTDAFRPAPKPGELTKTPEFKKLDAATQTAVTDALAAAKTPDAQQNVANLVSSPGFQKLPAAQQGEALKALMKDPGNAEYAGGIKALVNNGGPYTELKVGSSGPAVKEMQQKLKDAGIDPGPIDGKFGPKTLAAVKEYQGKQGLKTDGVAGAETLGELNHKRFTGLSAASQSQVLQEVSNHPTDPGARETVETMALSPGFRQLDAAQQTKLLNLVGGTNRDISKPTRDAMNTLVTDSKFTGATAADQKAQLQKFLTDETGLPGVVAPETGAFDGKRAKSTTTGPVEEKDHAFRGGKADALKYEVEIDGKKIPVYMPKNPDASLKYHSIEEVTKGLAALPPSSRALVTEVSVEQKVNPDDAYWATQYKDPNFHSYMTAGAAGSVSIYPSVGSNPSQSYLDGTMIHETGHTLSKQKWGEDTDARWADWDKAAASDGTHASAYAKNSKSEDFAETLQLYQQVKGTPQEAEVRALMPERFKIIDDVLAGKR